MEIGKVKKRIVFQGGVHNTKEMYGAKIKRSSSGRRGMTREKRIRPIREGDTQVTSHLEMSRMQEINKIEEKKSPPHLEG